MSRPPVTRPPPNPDPLDAAEEALARARRANNALRDADDFEDPTGRHEVQPVQVYIQGPTQATREPQPSYHEADVPKTDTRVGQLIGALAGLVAVGVAICKALGWL